MCVKKFNVKPFKPISSLVVNIRYSESRQKAEILTDQYVKVSSDEMHSVTFQRRKIDEETQNFRNLIKGILSKDFKNF